MKMDGTKSISDNVLGDQMIPHSCHSCRSSNIDILVDLGQHPVSNRFLKKPQDKEKVFKIILGQYRNCALIQLIEHIPFEYIKPVYSWINYVEPEAHLDNLAAKVSKLVGINKDAKLLGLSYKDASFLERLKKFGYEGEILDISKPGLESMQVSFPNSLDLIIEKYGKVDLLVARHILEHSYDLDKFLSAMKDLISPSGYIIVEVPDFEKSLHNLDYPAIWEEHITYFTEHTLKRSFEKYNLTIEMIKNYPYPMENCLVLIARNSARKSGSDIIKTDNSTDINNPEIYSELELGKMFKESFANIKEGIGDFLRHSRTKGIAMMGAGHLGCAFVNYFGISKWINFFIDDNPDKKGLYMPGSKLEILDSSILKGPADCCIDTVLLSINPRNEDKCIENNKHFINGGGKFYSIFKNSSIPLPVFLDASELHLLKNSEEVYYAADEIAVFSQAHVDFLKSNMHNSKTGRIRICAHKSPEDMIHEMLIIIDGKSYIRPHKHIGKPESFHVIEGAIDVVLFDEEGNTVDVIKLCSRGSGNGIFYRLSKPQFHAVLVNSDHAIIIETTQGPFNKEDTIFAPWSPDEDHIEVSKYIERLKTLSYKSVMMKKIRKVG